MLKLPLRRYPGLMLLMILYSWVVMGCRSTSPEISPVSQESVPGLVSTRPQASPSLLPSTLIQPTAIHSAIPASLTPAAEVASPTQTPDPTMIMPTPTDQVVLIPALLPEVCKEGSIPESACLGVARNADWEPVVREINGFQMVLVPAGCFLMGNAQGTQKEQPVHPVCIDRPFWVDRTEVMVVQYTDFMNAPRGKPDDVLVWTDPNGRIFIQVEQEGDSWVPMPGDRDRPLESVPYAKAVEYCNWRAGRLLTEAEWEFAARGPDGWLYPWGNEFDPEKVVRIRGKTPPVGSKPQGASWVGAFDLSSSLFEWVSSIYRPYPYDPTDGREAGLEADGTSERVLRGGAWYHAGDMHDNLTATGRVSLPPGYVVWPLGMRCAQSLEEPARLP